MLTKRNCNLPLICLVCGDTARGINFNVMSCSSCKIFFRRYAGKSKHKPRLCWKENNCEIDRRTRGHCSTCRLKKCFAVGMDPDLIGSHRYTVDKSKKLNQLPKPCTLNLLQNDRSTLTTDDWNLLSNIIHAYDTISIIPQTKQLLLNQSMLPLKIRSKPSTILSIFERFFSSLTPFIQCTSFYQELTPDTYSRIVRNNLPIFGVFHTGFVLREIDGMSYPAIRTGLSAFYSEEIIQTIPTFISRLETNVALITVILMMLVFSNNCGLVSFIPSETNFTVENSVSVLRAQNIMVTMFWKYLLYQFGFAGAVQKFSSHIKYIVDLLYAMHERENLENAQSVYKMIDDARRVLVIEE